jgi:hypothetical protein
MLNVETLRRSGFRSGPSILLADGQEWIFPMPALPGVEGADSTLDRDTRAILQAIREAEDRNDLLRAELSLAILLLSKNYRLEPEQYQELLCFDRSSPTLASAQEAFHRLAMAYLRRLDPDLVGAVDDRQAGFGSLLRLIAHLHDRIAGRRPSTNPVNPIGSHSN